MPIVLYEIWKFLKRTVFSLTWWKTHWYLPWVFIAALLMWIMTGGSGSPLALFKRFINIRADERESITRIEERNVKVEKELEETAEKAKDKVKDEIDSKLEREKQKLKKERELLSGNSEAVNKALNDILND